MVKYKSRINKNKKFAFFEIEDWEKEYMEKELPGFEISFFSEHLELENVHLAKECKIISVFTVSQVNKEVLSKLPDLKLIVTRATGFDNIDIEEARKNPPDYYLMLAWPYKDAILKKEATFIKNGGKFIIPTNGVYVT